ncbi:MAG: hypothetical protein KGL39_12350 [Patescibacteria group bacterium]|nr:hypothetical protein [Patescibacteria group bacterium]
MMKMLLAAATIAATLGPAAAQSITLDATSSIGRQALCKAEWKKQTDPQVKEYGSQYFQKICTRKLKAEMEAKSAQVQPSAAPRR